MRSKIIAVNALIVAVVGLLSFMLMRVALSAAAGNKDALVAEAKHDVQGAAARLQLDGLRAERWLTTKANEPATTDALTKATPAARGDAAKARADELVAQMKAVPLFEGNVPTFVGLVDASGKLVGRNGSDLARGDDFAAVHPELKQTLGTGQAGSDVWLEKDRSLVSYVAVRDGGKVVGALIIGRPLSDTLSRVSEATTGRALALVITAGDKLDVAAKSATISAGLDDAVNGAAKEGIRAAITRQESGVTVGTDMLVATAPLEGLGDGKRAALVGAAPAALIEGVGAMPLPILGATALGILLVLVAGWLLGNYITRPINQLEEGLLAILNGQTERRFELDHAELGGLAFRIDQLLNQLMGVEEDTTDAEGRVSRPPRATDFTDAMAVDDKRLEGEGTLDPDAVVRLRAEPAEQYYARIYREYIAAKKANGEQTDHITEQAFAQRIQGMETDASAKYGRPVRYQVQQRGREVVLLAIPLP